jgi:adenosylcobinamide-phosphate synthase
MGWWITLLRRGAEAWAGTRAWKLRLAGGLITLVLVGCSVLAGWGMERLAPTPLLVVALASALAGRSLEQAVGGVLKALPNSVQAVQKRTVQNQTDHVGDNPTQPALQPARRALAWIVGRDTADLDAPEILRALAETASENGVDGLFAPLFWMLLGAGLWSLNPAWPGPLALAWGFKAASTLDSMLGYRRGRLRWLGTAGARLDDLLVWLPCRLVAVSLPLAAGKPGRSLGVLAAARRDGAADPSPNAGLSQAAYAHVTGVQLGGRNSYGGQIRSKPLLGAGLPVPDQAAVLQMLHLNRQLELLWLTAAAAGAFITKTLS